MPIYKFIRQSFIVIMLLSFSVSVLSSQIGSIPFASDTNINVIDPSGEVGISNSLGNDHCNELSNTQHCNNCSHCTVLFLTTMIGDVTKFSYSHHYSAFVPVISIDIPIKPPRM